VQIHDLYLQRWVAINYGTAIISWYIIWYIAEAQLIATNSAIGYIIFDSYSAEKVLIMNVHINMPRSWSMGLEPLINGPTSLYAPMLIGAYNEGKPYKQGSNVSN